MMRRSRYGDGSYGGLSTFVIDTKSRLPTRHATANIHSRFSRTHTHINITFLHRYSLSIQANITNFTILSILDHLHSLKIPQQKLLSFALPILRSMKEGIKPAKKLEASKLFGNFWSIGQSGLNHVLTQLNESRTDTLSIFVQRKIMK